MPTVKLSPLLNGQIVDENGAPAVGWQISSYVAGSSTPLATYTTAAGDVQHANPELLDALGYPSNGQIWLESGKSYKLVLADGNGVVKKTFDNIAGVNDTTISVGQWQASGITPTYISANSFSLPGDQTTEFHLGRREQLITATGTLYGQIIKSVYSGGLTTVTVLLDSGSLDNGLSSVNHSILRADHTGEISNPSGKNRVINGAFNVNERGYISGTVQASGSYAVDRWKSSSANSSMTFTTAPQGQMVTLVGSYQQRIERANMEAGSYMVSWQGSAQCRIYRVGDTPPAYSVSPIVFVSDGTTDVMIEFNAGTLWKVQVELGGAITPFEFRHISQEKWLCAWFYERITFTSTIFSTGQATSATNASGSIPFKHRKRSQGSAIFSGTPVALAANGAAASGTVLIPSATEDMAVWQFSGTGLAAGNACSLNGTGVQLIADSDF